MEKTTKKSKKKSRRLKKRIGIIAVGGLSFVLTICLSVGATLAWFAGSSWASNDLYMGGPVYVEMAGKGTAPESGTGDDKANWIGGAGNLDIKAAASRSAGTVGMDTDANGNYKKGDGTDDTIPDNVLLPGQKVQIFSQARVYSTAVTDSREDGAYDNNSSGANTANTSNPKTGTAQYVDGKGRVTSTTTSVLRARFSISIEFDPSVGFNNFTNEDYMKGYPIQSQDYGVEIDGETYDVDHAEDIEDLTWKSALSTDGSTVWSQDIDENHQPEIEGRRDGVAAGTKWQGGVDADACATLVAAGSANRTSIYKWRYCSATEYTNAAAGAKMPAPFNGTVESASGVGYYGLWILDGDGNKTESDAFFKARTNAYLQSYVEFYENEYGNTVTRTIQNSINSLDTALNNDFKRLINDSSDDIQNGLVYGYTVTSGVKTPIAGSLTTSAGATGSTGAGINASWLYIDPSIGNDTNTNEISTSTGGWWYLVESDGVMDGNANTITLTADETDTAAGGTDGTGKANSDGINTPKTEVTVGAAKMATAKRNTAGFAATDEARKLAKLYEIDPTIELQEVGKNGSKSVKKVASVSFPFVNGTFALPGDALTNIFANAKISFQISFQAIQAFFPYTNSIDGLTYENDLFGVAKVLNIKNAIPIFNEAFDYQETFTDDSSSIPL